MRIILVHLIGILFLSSCVKTQERKKGDITSIENNTITQLSIPSDSEHNGSLRILNAGPRGGNYVSSTGTNYRYTVFRAQITNDTNNPISLDINFPTNPISLLPDSTIELNVFLVPEKYHPIAIKDTLNFGLDIDDFFESSDSQKFELNSVIEPNEQHTLYIGILFESETANGITRSQLTVEGPDELPFYPVESTVHYKLKNQPLNLIYGISFDAPNNYISFPCGHVQLKEF